MWVANVKSAPLVSVSRPLDLRLRAQIDGAPFADIAEMLVHEPPRSAFAAQAQHLEEIIVRGEFAERVEMRTEAFEYDAMDVDTPVFARSGATRQPALIDQAGDKIDGAIFIDERGVERDLVDAIHDLARGGRRFVPH